MFEPRLGRERSGPGLASLPGPCYVYVMHLHWLTVWSPKVVLYSIHSLVYNHRSRGTKGREHA